MWISVNFEYLKKWMLFCFSLSLVYLFDVNRTAGMNSSGVGPFYVATPRKAVVISRHLKLPWQFFEYHGTMKQCSAIFYVWCKMSKMEFFDRLNMTWKVIRLCKVVSVWLDLDDNYNARNSTLLAELSKNAPPSLVAIVYRHPATWGKQFLF